MNAIERETAMEMNPVFKTNYEGYLRALDKINLLQRESVLDISVDELRRTAQIPFFQTDYQVSPSGVEDHCGNRPDYGICVILLKYLLMCPEQISQKNSWINYRDLKDSGQTHNAALSDYATQMISKHFKHNSSGLKAAAQALGGKRPDTDYPYDLSAEFTALPRIPILFLFNDADNQFPPQALILFEQRAETFLDAECLVMVCWYLFEHLKQAEQASAI